MSSNITLGLESGAPHSGHRAMLVQDLLPDLRAKGISVGTTTDLEAMTEEEIDLLRIFTQRYAGRGAR